MLSYCLGEQESTVHCDTCVDLRVRRRMSSLSHRLPASLDSKSAYREEWGGGAGGVSLWTSSGAREEQHVIRYPIAFCLTHFRRVSHWAGPVVRKPSGYSICVPCPAFYMGSEELSSGSHTAHAYPHVCSPVTWHLHACAVSIPCCSLKLSRTDINTHSVNLSTHTHWPFPHNKNIYGAPNISRFGTGVEAKAVDTKSLNSIIKDFS